MSNTNPVKRKIKDLDAEYAGLFKDNKSSRRMNDGFEFPELP